MKLVKCFLIISLIAFGFGCSKVPAGYVGVKVYLLGTNKGVDSEVLGVGRYLLWFNEELFIYPTYQINYVFTKDSTEGSPDNEEFTFQTGEGLTCGVDLGISLHFDKNKVSKMFQQYRKGPDEIRGVVVRNAIRDALNKVSSTMPIESVYGERKAELFEKVQSIVSTQLDPSGIIIDKISIVGSIRLPEPIQIALNSKVAATQHSLKVENELRSARAEAQKTVAKAEGEAKANEVVANSVNDKIITWKRLQNESKAIDKWNGELSQVSGGGTPFVNITTKK
jgi:regulator of protease activity HflC (stomatin/prohibitin superfamily)